MSEIALTYLDSPLTLSGHRVDVIGIAAVQRGSQQPLLFLAFRQGEIANANLTGNGLHRQFGTIDRCTGSILTVLLLYDGGILELRADRL